ncbi:uncharacterized protein BP01DRAFT_99268 [Aspergillus saccharolyticus JOP 1030-1]|uniref:DUF7703 domain-containing protein n=1 Tax=Aspergillus saccharolyticus JOP 1030-1 TaxID=1450539 RepID=A0A318ZIF1_9EURO|nr:hypothetical protein BP01DRAFT_99268 [Aspergillus saccharolyticus JOP 1030-1]PYH43470.1 hypothetical protein BP01DRAFT_99268 [Aspergillus saccharolyticus JOP 1030-1]
MSAFDESHKQGSGFSAVIPGDTVQKYVISAFAAITWYNAIELVVLCLTTFQRYRGCYFWSLLITSFSLIPHVLGYTLFLFTPFVSRYISVTLIVLTWYCMVTGHSLVLWSRLHLVLQHPKLLHWILGLIILDAVLFHVPTTVLLYGALTKAPAWQAGYNAMERIQLIAFCVQEAFLSGIYVYETIRMLRLRPERPRHLILTQLLIINIAILILDLAVVAIEYAGYYALQVMFKPVAYSIKLKLEYAILGRLVQIAKGPSLDGSDPLSNPSATSAFVTTPQGWEECLEGGGRNSNATTVVRPMESGESGRGSHASIVRSRGSLVSTC